MDCCLTIDAYFAIAAAMTVAEISLASPASASEAVAIQQVLRHRVRLENDFGRIERIAGVDVSYDMKRDMSLAFIVLMAPDELKPLAWVKAELPTPFPYIPGLLSFREIPVILKALALLSELPDLLMVDGQGVAHPRRLGIAAHLGVITDLPAIGIAKSRLTGRYVEPGEHKGDISPLMDGAERIGTVLRSKEGTLPLFISPGHRINHATAVELTVQCLTRYRLPEPTRIADKLSKEKKAPDALL
jgi:deoxyribonuclease V